MRYRIYILYISLVMTLSCCLPTLAQKRVYDEKHPIIIAGDWDKPPYEYQNDHGEPAGSNIDMMQAIMKQLGYPCKFVLKEWGNAIKAFERGEADLILANSNRFRSAPYCHSHHVINYYRMRALMLGDTVPPISVKQLVEGGVVLKPSDFTLAYFLVEDSSYIRRIDFQSPKVALLGLRDKDYKYFVWGEEPLKWKLKEFSMEHEKLILNEVKIPVSQIQVIGRDQALINAIDDVYARLKQSGEIEAIKQHWLHPEDENRLPDLSLTAYIILGIIILTIFCYLLNRLAQSHVRKAARHSTELNEMMLKALHMGRFYVMQYDIHHQRFTNLYGSFLPKDGMSLKEFVDHIHPSEQEEFMKKMDMMIQGREHKTAIDKRWNIGTAEQPQWLNFSGHSMIEYDDYGHPAYIINTINDITKDVEGARTAHEMIRKYDRLTNIPSLSMSFYNKKGELIAVNDSMKELCEFNKPENERFFRLSNMFEIPIFRDTIPRDHKDSTSACHRMEKPNKDGKDTYIEYDIRPLLDEHGEIFNYIISAIDVTEARDRDLDMHKMNREIQEAVKQTNQLELQLQYILENTNMYVFQIDFQNRLISYTRQLSSPEYVKTFEEYSDCVFDAEKESAMKGLEDKEIWRKQMSFDRHFKKPLVGEGNTDHWYNISSIPILDEQGQIKGAFGILRDITQQLEAQRKLKEETLRAESSGQQKSMFLASMTHELRTPLNSIVGFSDLLRTIDTPEERKEFIHIIRTHCDILLRLINDILEASNISDTLMQIVPEEVDFAQEFDLMCQTLEQRVDNPNVAFIKDNPYQKLVTVLDKGRIQQIITNFVTNAVKYTTEGHIRVGYREETKELDGEKKTGLYFYCEDTGSGIPEEKQDAVFERFVKLNEFVQGTGLGLSICKNIVERCEGQIGVSSEVGKGSTFWFWIPVNIYNK